MRSIRIIFLLLFVMVVSLPVKSQLFEFSSRDAQKIADRSLIVVVLEEDPALVKRFSKKPENLARYQSLIARSNSLLKKSVAAFWKANGDISYKTKSECISLSAQSLDYFTLDFASFWQNENIQLYRLNPDSLNEYACREQLMQRKEFGYFELKLIEKFRGSPFYVFHTPSSIPNAVDFASATMFISALVDEKLINSKFSTRDYELKIQQANALLASKTLWVDTSIVNRQGKKFDFIAQEYDSLSAYSLSNATEIGKRFFANDSTAAILNVVPYIDPISRGQSYIGTSGGSLNEYEKTIYYMQLIFDASTGALLYYDKSEERVIVAKDWRRFQRYSRESTFIMPKFNNNTAPTQEKQYQQKQ